MAGERDPDTLTEVAWSALHGVATLTRARRIRPDYHQARLTMLADQLAGVPCRGQGPGVAGGGRDKMGG
jgi:hypothetical protein